MRAVPVLLLLVLSSLTLGCGPTVEGAGPGSGPTSADAVSAVGAARAATAAAAEADVRALVNRQVAEYLATDPELATSLGVSPEEAGGPYLDRLVDYSPAAEAARRAMFRRFVRELDAVDREGLSREAAITLDVARSIYGGMTASSEIEYGRQYPFWYYGHTPYVVNQISGPHIDIPNILANDQAVGSVEQVEAYLRRLSAIGPTFAGIEAKVRSDARLGVTPPRILLERTLEVLDGFLADPPAENTLVSTLGPKLEAADIPAAERTRIVAEAARRVESVVYPAYRSLRGVIAELVPTARTEAGVWALPDGAAFYRANIRALGGSDLSPDSIHAIGLAEVDRITAEIDGLLRSQGLTEGTVGERLAALGDDPRHRYPDSDEGRATLLDDLNGFIDAMEARMPRAFSTIPPQEVEVRRIPAFSEATAPGGYYSPPAMDGSRPGVYFINLRDMEGIRRFALKTLTYHEAVPGHHHQIATALSAGNPALVQRISPLNAYIEGWALYAERLAWEMGMYDDDPFSDIGRLVDELFRAVRLVVDTGMHHRRWTREEAIDYMTSVTGKHASEVVPEIERYMAWPGQALGYKMGMIRILELREEARSRLGDAFDIRGFHDAVLVGGAVPMDVLERKVDRWSDGAR